MNYISRITLIFLLINVITSQLCSHNINNFTDSTDLSSADYDGPYIFYNEENLIAKQVLYLNGSYIGKTDTLHLKTNEAFTVQVNDTFTFSFQLKPGDYNEPCYYDLPEKLAIISDVEGNFFSLREFLVNNKIIDNYNNWIFGNGHLVLTGDMFDRGLYVTQTLWFIYKLEQEAAAAGGYVHFILGNHEIMNMNNDLRYVRKKYFENCKLMNEEYKYLYTMQTELGRWLNSKNIMEKIGQYFFVHGGISQEFASGGFDINQINSKAREYYFNSRAAKNSGDTLAKLIFSGKTSPFWYRGYIDGTADEKNIDLLLNTINCDKIIVGHTIVEDIKYFYNGKIIGVDTDHASGDTEGLLIENAIEYRVDISGNRSTVK